MINFQKSHWNQNWNNSLYEFFIYLFIFLDVLWCMHLRTSGHKNGFLMSCIMHMWVWDSLLFLSERSAVDRQSQGQFLTLSPRFVCGIPGMCRNVGSDRWRGPPQQKIPRYNPKGPSPLLSPSFSSLAILFTSTLHPAWSLSFKFSFALCLKNEFQETALLFSLCTRWAQEAER